MWSWVALNQIGFFKLKTAFFGVNSTNVKLPEVQINAICFLWFKNSYFLICKSFTEKETLVRKVKETGFFNFANQGFFLSEAFANKEIAVFKSQKANCIDLYFRQFHIGRINTEKRCFEFKKAYLIEGDPRPHYPFNV